MISNPVLSEELTDFKSKYRMLVQLYTNRIEFHDVQTKTKRTSRVVLIQDISGSALSKIKDNDFKAYLTIYTYVRQKNGKRKREELVMELNEFKTYEENFRRAVHWDTELNILLKTSENALAQKPLLIFVNPKSGAGKAKNIFYERALTIFNEAKVPHVLVMTEYANHAKEYIQTLNLNSYSGIIAISGDGLIYEIINGLAARSDCKEAIRMPIGQIPGGSANALACSLSYISDETFRTLKLEEFATAMTFNLVKSKPIPLDIISIQLCDKTIVQSFLSVQWAIIADVDLESEKFRYLGELRFTIGAIKRILDLRVYRGRVSFLPTEEYVNYKPKDKSIKLIQNNYEADTNEISHSSFPFNYLRPFNEPVPNDWLIMEENYILFLIMNLPILTPDFTATTQAKSDDACMHMIFIKSGISKYEIIKLFSDTESGNHMDSPYVEYVKIKAFRLEPLPLEAGSPVTGNLMIDGEKIPYGNIQGEVMPSLANVYAFRKD